MNNKKQHLKNNITVAAIVVTYNRKYLLKECLDALLVQSYPLDKIIIVDNASSDGTFEFLSKYGYLKNDMIDYIQLKINTGGSGGFNIGIKRAYEKFFDYVWLMDDDVIANQRSLEFLMLSLNVIKGDFGFLCSNVYGIDGQSMNLPLIDLREGNNNYPQWNTLLEHGIVKVKEATFVSLLIPMKVIKKVGLPIKEFFIWGDDTEYTNRITDHFPGYLVGLSSVCHKRPSQKRLDIDTEDNINRINFFYYLYRNRLYIHKKYYGIKKSLFVFLKHGVFMTYRILKRPNHRFLKLIKMYHGIISGIFFHPSIEHLD